MYLSPALPGERAIIYNSYEPEVVKLFSSLVTDDVVVFDVGAWIGNYAMLAAHKAKEVVAIEMDAVNVERIHHHISINHLHNVRVINVGVSNRQGNAAIDVDQSSLMRRITKESKTIISLDTLDNLSTQYDRIDIMIMDIEGHELYALKGMKKLLGNRTIKHLIIEVHPKLLQELNASDSEVLQLLTTNGYNVDKFHVESDAAYHIYAKATK
jgi:FkbM family methyltransferase